MVDWPLGGRCMYEYVFTDSLWPLDACDAMVERARDPLMGAPPLGLITPSCSVKLVKVKSAPGPWDAGRSGPDPAEKRRQSGLGLGPCQLPAASCQLRGPPKSNPATLLHHVATAQPPRSILHSARSYSILAEDRIADLQVGRLGSRNRQKRRQNGPACQRASATLAIVHLDFRQPRRYQAGEPCTLPQHEQRTTDPQK